MGRMRDFHSNEVEIAQVQDPADLFSSMVGPEPGFWSRSTISFRVRSRAEPLTFSSQCVHSGKVLRLVEIQTSGATQHRTNQIVSLACIQAQSSSGSALLVSTNYLQFSLVGAQK